MDDIQLGALQHSKDPPQRKNSNKSSHTKHVDVKFTKRITERHLYRINKTRVNPKRKQSVERTPKVDAWKLVQMWGISIKISKKNFLDDNYNSVWGVTIPLTKWFIKSQEMF